jgi:hypothetical protein
LDNLFAGENFRKSYLAAKGKLSDCGSPYSRMNPQLAEGVEFSLSQERLGGNFALAGLLPQIIEKTENLTIPAQTAPTFTATVSDLSGQTEVWAVVEPPYFKPPPLVQDLQAPEVALPTFDLIDEENEVLDGVFVGTYSGFGYNGQYKIVFYARNADGLVNNAPPTVVTVYGGTDFSVDPGDVNHDETVNLIDAILAFQVVSEIEPSATIYYEADVNGDGSIGTAEAIYILQKTAGLRN